MNREARDSVLMTCEECDRQDYGGFVWFQGEICLCKDEEACKRRQEDNKSG